MADLQANSAFFESDVVAIVHTDASGAITYANRAFYDLVGYGEGSELPTFAQLTGEEFRTKDDEALSRLAADGKVAPYGKELVRLDGTRIGVLGAPSRVGELTVWYLLDRTERRTVELSLLEQEETLLKILDSALDAVITIDENDIITDWRGCSESIFGWSKEEALGRELVDLIIPPKYRERHLEGLERYLKTGIGPVIGKRIEIEALDKTGRLFPVELAISAVMVKGNRMFSAFLRDLTEQRALDAEILSLNQELERRVEERTGELQTAYNELESFSYSVSHDLRAPIRAMNAFSSILLEDYGDKLDQDGKDHLIRIKAASLNMSRMIQDLLNLARVTRSELAHEPVDFSALAESIAAEIREREPDRSLQFQIEPGLHATGDPGLFRVVFENLLDNAWKFTATKPVAVIEVGSVPGDEKVFFVRDNGIGFEQAYEYKIFGVFERLHSVDEFSGTGIGLATVQRIIKRHGGSVWAEGRPGKGSTFFFSLPV